MEFVLQPWGTGEEPPPLTVEDPSASPAPDPIPEQVIPELVLLPNEAPISAESRVNQVSPSAAPPPPDKRLVGGLVALSLLAVLGLFRVYGASDQTLDSKSPDPSPQAAILENAANWLDRAGQSLALREYEAAATQYQRGLELLQAGQAEESQLMATTKSLAEAEEGAGDLERAYELWEELDDPIAPEQKLRLAGLLRDRAATRLKEAAQLQQAGDLRGAEGRAKESLGLFVVYGGSDQQKAAAHDRMARVYLAQGRTLAAETEFRKAQRLEFSKEREKALASLAPGPVAPLDRRPPPASTTTVVVTKRPRLGLGGSVPQAAKRPVKTATRRAQRNVEEEVVQQQDQAAQEETEVPLGQRDVLESYRTTRRKTVNTIPGLR